MALSPVTFAQGLTAIFDNPALAREDRRQLIAQELFRASTAVRDQTGFFRDVFEFITIVNHNQQVRNGQLEKGTEKLESSNKKNEARIAELEQALKERKVETQKSDGNTALIIGGVEIAVLVSSLILTSATNNKSMDVRNALTKAASKADKEKLLRKIGFFDAASAAGRGMVASTVLLGPVVPGAYQRVSAWRAEKAEEKE